MRHAPAPAMPDALRARPDDDSYLRDSIEIFPGSDVGDAYEKVAAELRGFKSRNFLFWSDIPPGIANGRKRADEIIAADEAGARRARDARRKSRIWPPCKPSCCLACATRRAPYLRRRRRARR